LTNELYKESLCSFVGDQGVALTLALRRTTTRQSFSLARGPKSVGEINLLLVEKGGGGGAEANNTSLLTAR